MSKKLIVKQIKSEIKSRPAQRATLHGLGLRKINAEREHDDNKVIRGMIENRPDLLFAIFAIVALGFVALTLPMGLLATSLSQRLAVKR